MSGDYGAQHVDDDWGKNYVPDEATMPQRQPGLWQRVGEYWWEGMNAGEPDNAYSGKYDAQGNLVPVSPTARNTPGPPPLYLM